MHPSNDGGQERLTWLLLIPTLASPLCRSALQVRKQPMRMAGMGCVCSQHWPEIQQRLEVDDVEVTPMATEMRTTGIDVVGDVVAWGAHFCLFYETKEDLLDLLISYCRMGLERGEYCLWLVAEPLTIEEARDALQDTVPDLDRYLADSRLEIVSARDWFLQGGTFDCHVSDGASLVSAPKWGGSR